MLFFFHQIIKNNNKPALTTSSRVLRRERTESEMERKTRTAIKLQFWQRVLRRRRDCVSLPGTYMQTDSVNLEMFVEIDDE